MAVWALLRSIPAGTTNTYAALAALTDYGIISPEDYPQLRKAYTFFRWLIDGLRVVDASIMPADCRANLNFTVMMIAEKIAAGRSPAPGPFPSAEEMLRDANNL